MPAAILTVRIAGTGCDAPSGCCERDYAINNDIAITVCDQSWRKSRDNNNRRRYAKSFATLEDTYTEEWRKIAGNYPGVTRNGFKEWIRHRSARSTGLKRPTGNIVGMKRWQKRDFGTFCMDR